MSIYVPNCATCSGIGRVPVSRPNDALLTEPNQRQPGHCIGHEYANVCVHCGEPCVDKALPVEESELLRQLLDRYTSLGEMRTIVESDFRRIIAWARNGGVHTDYATAIDRAESACRLVATHYDGRDDHARDIALECLEVVDGQRTDSTK